MRPEVQFYHLVWLLIVHPVGSDTCHNSIASNTVEDVDSRGDSGVHVKLTHRHGVGGARQVASLCRGRWASPSLVSEPVVHCWHGVCVCTSDVMTSTLAAAVVAAQWNACRQSECGMLSGMAHHRWLLNTACWYCGGQDADDCSLHVRYDEGN